MAVAGAIEIMRPALLIAKVWCEACFTGVHKNCEDHAKDKSIGHETVDEA